MLNKVMLIGYVGVDPKSINQNITTCSLATSEKWKDNQGVSQEHTEWHNLTFYGKLAEMAMAYLKKGMNIYVDGTIQTDKFTNKEGVECKITKVVVKTLRMLSAKNRQTEREPNYIENNNTNYTSMTMHKNIPQNQNQKQYVHEYQPDNDMPF